MGLLAGLHGTAAAQSTTHRGTWLAASADQAASSWGRLTVKDGLLTFSTNDAEWRKPLSEIKRVSEHNRAIEIEAHNGEKLTVSILGQQMIAESPRKAIEIIQKAVRAAPPVQTTVVAAAGGGS